MYPYLKLISIFIGARFRPKMRLDDKCTLTFRAGLSDIDLFMELNNARYFTYMELARWDHGYRIGLLDIMRKKKWGLTVGGASIRFRRRIPFLSKFTLTTQPVCHDGRWFYFLQETFVGGNICSSALMKLGVTSRQGLVLPDDVLKEFGRGDWGAEVPEWVMAWQEAEGTRPWPGK